MKPDNCMINRRRTKSGRVILCFCIIFAGAIALWVSNAAAQETKRSEYEVKAAFVYNFLKFVEWPDKAFAEKPSTMNLCIVGEDPFGDALKIFAGDTVRNKPIEIKRPDSLQGAKICHVIFISRSERERLPQIMKAIRGLNILSIGDTDSFERQGVIINFSIVQNKVRFEINVTAARQAGIRISSKLLRLARTVYE